MASLDQALEEGQVYGSPTEFLDQVDSLPEDQTYWLDNSKGRKETFESLEGLKGYLENLEDNWEKYREFIPLESNSDRVEHRSTEELEYLDVKFPYIGMETEHGSSTQGSISLGFMAKESQSVQGPMLKAND